MRQIGQIKHLQVQLDSLKRGTKPNQDYDPSALQRVSALQLTAKGVVGLLDGEELLDVHHADHEYSRDRDSSGISFNFSSHYQRMRDRFSPRLEIGCAGENILIATDRVIDLTALSDGLIIENGQGLQVRLSQIQVAHPCLSFSKYALSVATELTEETLKEALRFLDGGTRGFYCEWTGEPVVVRVGDRVIL